MFILGCPCGLRIQIAENESRREIRCSHCGKYIKIPVLKSDIKTQTLLSASKDGIIGKILAKRYKISSYLADGAMGRVYRGTDLLLNLPVAIKILKPLYPISEQQERRFIHEAHIASELVHPGIVMVRNLHRSRKGGYFMVMDLCPGKSLKTILATRHHLSVQESLEITRQILSALKLAHEKGVVHRDIKPGNIMVEEKEKGLRVRILDFGIAKVFSTQGGLDLQSLTRTGFIIGTTYYMAPEQIMKTPLSPATDIYGVGALLYHLLTGFPPFVGSREKVLRSIIKKNPRPMREIFAKTPHPQSISFLLDAIILKSMSKEAKHRFSSAQEFIDAIELCQKNILSLTSLKWIAQSYWGRLDKEIRSAMLVVLAFLFLIPLPIYIKKKISMPVVQQTQIEEALNKEEYLRASFLLAKAQNYTKEKKLEILKKAFFSALKEEKEKNAQQLINLISQEINNRFLSKILSTFFHEDIKLQQIERYLEQKQFIKAWELCHEELSEEYQVFLAREERKDWLKRIGKYNTQEHEVKK